MDRVKLVVKTESANLWWGIYGFCEKTGWEDITIFTDNNEKVGQFCLNSKSYLRKGVEDLRDDTTQDKFVHAIEEYLIDSKIHYWFYYNKPSDDFYEVSYKAPVNDKGEKPRYMEIWHPDEGIDISTIYSAVANFSITFLELDNADIQIMEGESLEESFKSYKENLKYFGFDGHVDITFSNDLVKDLAALWKKSPEEVLDRLNKAV